MFQLVQNGGLGPVSLLSTGYHSRDSTEMLKGLLLLYDIAIISNILNHTLGRLSWKFVCVEFQVIWHGVRI